MRPCNTADETRRQAGRRLLPSAIVSVWSHVSLQNCGSLYKKLLPKMRTRERESERERAITCTEAADIRFLYLLLSQKRCLTQRGQGGGKLVQGLRSLSLECTQRLCRLRGESTQNADCFPRPSIYSCWYKNCSLVASKIRQLRGELGRTAAAAADGLLKPRSHI